MAQVGWVYLDDFGGRHRIGLYHGDRTGHLLIHCDARIVQVDFSVKESQTYSFFVEDELCEVSVVKETGGFTYDFQVNKKIDTPRNRLRKADERRNRGYMALMVAGLVLVVAGTVTALRWWGRHQAAGNQPDTSLTAVLSPENEARLLVEGQTAEAQLVVVEENYQRQIYYGFILNDGYRVSGRFQVADTGQIILPNGFPLHDRDAFLVRYLPSAPAIHRIDFDAPTAETLAGYLERAFAAEQQGHPQATEGHSRCVVRLIREKKGWRQLADLIFQQAPPGQNPKNNRDSYLRLIRDPEVAGWLKAGCWDQ